MTVPTVQSLARSSRRLDRVNAEVRRVVIAMQTGASLRRSFRPTPYWQLSTGLSVSDAAARLITARPDVIGVGDALFGAELSQTFRYVATQRR